MSVPAWVKGALLFALTLGAGIAIGIGFERLRAPAHQRAGRDAHHLMQRLHHHLGLDSAQHEAIAAILARRQGAVDSTWHTLQPQLRALLDSTLREVVAVLRPEQLEKYRRLVDARHPGALP